MELIALTKVLELGQGQKVNVHTNSWYLFAMGHAHGVIYKERGLLNMEGKIIKIKMRSWPYLKPYGYPSNWSLSIAQGTREGMNLSPGTTI